MEETQSKPIACTSRVKMPIKLKSHCKAGGQEKEMNPMIPILCNMLIVIPTPHEVASIVVAFEVCLVFMK